MFGCVRAADGGLLAVAGMGVAAGNSAAIKDKDSLVERCDETENTGLNFGNVGMSRRTPL